MKDEVNKIMDSIMKAAHHLRCDLSTEEIKNGLAYTDVKATVFCNKKFKEKFGELVKDDSATESVFRDLNNKYDTICYCISFEEDENIDVPIITVILKNK